MAKARVKKSDPEEKKQRLVGVFWQSETKSGFVGRFVEGYMPHPDDEDEGRRRASTWRAWERYAKRTAVVRGQAVAQ